MIVSTSNCGATHEANRQGQALLVRYVEHALAAALFLVRKVPPLRQRRKPRAAHLGVTDAEYNRLLATQGGGCAIQSADYRCTVRAVTRRYHADHDHKTNAVRGLLCHTHNRRLWKGATPAELRALADYLDEPDPLAQMIDALPEYPPGLGSAVWA